ncbi:hypothetical protein AeNC1_009510 [Aphanomyces euteiches]|nr:hypothetical protein AeNC1_009510 [Aphanomyces euteiches]
MADFAHHAVVTPRSDDIFVCAQEEPVNVKAELKQLLALAGPMCLTFLIESTQSTISVALVGSIESEQTKELVNGAALSTSFTTLTVIAVVIGLPTALDTLCSQAYGSGNMAKMGTSLQSALLAMTMAFVPIFVINSFSDHILMGLGQDPVVCVLSKRFTLYVTATYPFYAFQQIVRKLLQAHNIVYPMFFLAVVSNAIHIGAGIPLTRVFGYDGAGLARVLCQAVYPILLAVYLWFRPVYKQWHIQWSLQTAWTNLREFFQFGLPGLLMMMLEFTAFEILTLLSGLLPDNLVALGANSILMNIIILFYNTYLGMAIASGVRVGIMVGAGQIAHAKCILKLAFGTFLCCIVLTALLFYFLRIKLPPLFVSDVDISKRAEEIIPYIVPLHMMDALNGLSQAVLRALGRPAFATYVNAGAYYLVGIPLAAAFAFGLHWSSEGLWSGFTSASLCACCIYAFYFTKRLNWIQVVDEAKVRNE